MHTDRSWEVVWPLNRWLEKFRVCFGHPAQIVSLRKYFPGLISDSQRKSMPAMLARLTEPVHYQALQHFITDAPWDAGVVWRQLLELLPERTGALIIDNTGFPKQGRHSVGVSRQYSGTLGKIGNCQIGVTAALWTGLRACLLGAEHYLPRQWLAGSQRERVRVAKAKKFAEKWRLALTLIRRARSAGMHITAVLADAGYEDVTAFRRGVERLRL